MVIGELTREKMCGFYQPARVCGLCDTDTWRPVNNLACVPGIFHHQELTMQIAWNKDPDAALAQAREQNKPVLLDFSAAPM
jgi:hypothetical protein